MEGLQTGAWGRVGGSWQVHIPYPYLSLSIHASIHPFTRQVLHISDGKESACNAGDPGSVPGSGRYPGEKNGYPFQYSCLENSMDRGSWGATVHGIGQDWGTNTTYLKTRVQGTWLVRVLRFCPARYIRILTAGLPNNPPPGSFLAKAIVL